MKVYYIGKNDNFIYKKLSYVKNGELHTETSYDNINLNPVINDNIFKIPPNHKIKIVRTTEEAYKMLWPVNIGTLNVNPLLTQTPGYGKK